MLCSASDCNGLVNARNLYTGIADSSNCLLYRPTEMAEHHERLLPSRVHGALSKVGKSRIDRLSRQFRRNSEHAANRDRGACFDVLGVFQSFPGAEARGVGTSRFFVDTQKAQDELVRWARDTVPQHRQSLEEIITALSSADPATPMDLPGLVARLQAISSGLDVYQHCAHLAPTTVPPANPPQPMDA
jgi:hypothetical protein